MSESVPIDFRFAACERQQSSSPPQHRRDAGLVRFLFAAIPSRGLGMLACAPYQPNFDIYQSWSLCFCESTLPAPTRQKAKFAF